MKLDKKYSHFLVIALMAVIMTSVISFVMTYVALGFVSDFLFIWLGSIPLGFVVSYPAALVALPFSQKIVKRIIE